MQMSRQRAPAHQRTYPDLDGENRVIGLRAVAAAIRYRGDADNAERSPTKERPALVAAVKQPRDTQA
jgi:hypothetical protein